LRGCGGPSARVFLESEMATYKELVAQAEELMKQAEAARKAEIAGAIAEIKSKMAEFGITVADLGGTVKKATGGKAAVAAKYRNPADGKTWSGRGRTPVWLLEAEATGKKREEFAVG
jgi:DNA-binding protein H-NS